MLVSLALCRLTAVTLVTRREVKWHRNSMRHAGISSFYLWLASGTASRRGSSLSMPSPYIRTSIRCSHSYPERKCRSRGLLASRIGRFQDFECSRARAQACSSLTPVYRPEEASRLEKAFSSTVATVRTDRSKSCRCTFSCFCSLFHCCVTLKNQAKCQHRGGDHLEEHHPVRTATS